MKKSQRGNYNWFAIWSFVSIILSLTYFFLWLTPLGMTLHLILPRLTDLVISFLGPLSVAFPFLSLYLAMKAMKKERDYKHGLKWLSIITLIITSIIILLVIFMMANPMI